MRFFSKEKKTTIKTKTTLLIITGCAGSGKTSLGEKIAKELNWTYIDKDTVTRGFTDFILVRNGKSKSDRESDLYCDDIRPIEYEITFKVCDENLRLGNSVVLTIPFIAQIRDFSEWESLIDRFGLDFDDVNVKFVWINHDPGSEYTRITKRGAERDGWKLSNWDRYCSNMEGIYPDAGYQAYCFDNDSVSADAIKVEGIIEWIKR